MNLATPFLICNQNEEFRSLLREMLTKHGFFHVLETSSTAELADIMKREKKAHFVLVEGTMIDENLIPVLNQKDNFIVIGQPNDDSIISLAARFGVKRFMSFPFSSQNLLDKIQQLSQ